jgi:hypothetical protein
MSNDPSQNIAAFEIVPSTLEASDASEISAIRAELVAAEARADALREKVDHQAQLIARIKRELRAAEIAAMHARAHALQAVEAMQRAAEARKMKGRLRRVWAVWRRE